MLLGVPHTVADLQGRTGVPRRACSARRCGAGWSARGARRHPGAVAPPPLVTGADPIDRLIARIPVLLTALPLALLAYVSLVQRDEPGRLLAGLPALLLTVAYLRSGRGG